MPQKSFLEQLPTETLAACNRILQMPGMTIEKAVPLLEEIGVRVSKSAIGRHKKKIEDVSEDLRKSRVIAEAVGRDVADTPDDMLSSLNLELLQNEIFKTITHATDEDGGPGLDAKELRGLADAAYRLATAAKTNAERLFKVRAETADKTIAAANEQLKKSGQPGLSKETVDGIRHAVLGVTA